MLPNLVERLNLLGLVVPDKQLPFKDTILDDPVLCSRDSQTILQDTVKTHAISRGVLPALGENCDAVVTVSHVNVDLAILAIIFALETHLPIRSHLTAVRYTSGFVKRRPFHH